MPAEPTGIDVADADAIDRGYEARDVNVRAIVTLLGGFLLVFSLICGGLWWMYRHSMSRPIAGGTPVSVVERPGVVSDAPPLQPQPGHDSLDAWDLAKMRQNEDSVFDRLGWKRDERTHRYAVPETVLAAVRQRTTTRPATTPDGGGR